MHEQIFFFRARATAVRATMHLGGKRGQLPSLELLDSQPDGETPNYGFMIRIQDRRTGVANEAAEFYSPEYSKDLQPKLRVLCQSQPPFTFLVSTRVPGLPAELTTRVTPHENQAFTVRGETSGTCSSNPERCTQSAQTST